MKIIDNFGTCYNPCWDGDKVVLRKEMLNPGLNYVDFCFEEWDAIVGDSGYYIIADYEKTGAQLCHFTAKAEKQFVIKQNVMPIMGAKLQTGCYMIIVEGMSTAFHACIGLENGKYSIAARFDLEEERPYEDISFLFVSLGADADYSDIANYYRKYMLEFGGCIPLKERVKDNPYLSYAAESVQIRIRMGWKPAPPTILEQTRENEPEMLVACTFERVKDIIDELKRLGVAKAELCLVGWNKSGHDGRWPEMFPVEEKLGGEEKLRQLIQYAQDNGYQITCHTNSTDCYHIAQDFSSDIVEKRKDGLLVYDELAWSGGRMYHLCPVKAWEFAARDLPKVAELGFRGIHYVDVINVVPLRKCYDKNHPVNRKETADYYRRIGLLAKQQFGGFSSEGAFDFSADYLDYALYVTFSTNQEPFFDREIPLWQMVYNGIILSNPSTETVNYPVKPFQRELKLVECGGRPTFYFYSKFMTNSSLTDWLGQEDIGCGTDAELRRAVEGIKIAYEQYTKRKHLQYAFITKHAQIDTGIFEVTYSNGTVVRVNYNTGEVQYTEV